MVHRTHYPVNQTPVPRILLILIATLAVGALLASGTGQLPVRPGVIGLLLMLTSAGLARRHWQRQPPAEATGSPERALWHGLASHGVLAGHLAMGTWMLAPAFDMHGALGHAIATDSWTLILGALLSYAIARDPAPRQDERDAAIASLGWRWAHGTLLAMLVALILGLGFGAGTALARASHPMLAHLLILILLAHVLVNFAVRLHLYAREAEADAAGEAPPA